MTTKPPLTDSLTLISQHRIANVLFDNITHHYSLYATVAFNTGETIANFSAATTGNIATYLTVQTGYNTHITLEPAFLQYINHSCDPNVFFDTALMQLTSLKQIQAGEELCFFYPSAEWEMAQPFICHCGSHHCLQLINGAAHLSSESLRKYRLTEFISQQLKQKK